MSSHTSPFHLSPSAVARYFFLDCERFLRYWATPEHERAAAGIPEPVFDRSPLMMDVMASGLAWEEKVVGEILAGRVTVADGTGELSERRFDVDATRNWLRTASVGQVLYQGTLRPAARFHAAFGLDPSLVQFGDCHPDLIEVRDGSPGRSFRIIDIKRGESLQLVHRVQVLLYAFILDGLLSEWGLTDAQVDLQEGGVWLGDCPEPEPFAMDSLRPYLAQFLAEVLPRLLHQPAHEAFWHFTYNCERCGFADHCRKEMRQENDLSRLTNLTAHGKRHLTNLGVRTLPQLATFLVRDDADEQLGRCASLAGERHYLEGRLTAFHEQTACSHHSATALPRGENVAVFLTLQREPLGRTTYLAGLLVQTKKENTSMFAPALRSRLFDPAGSPVPCVLVSPTPVQVNAVRDEFVRILHDVLLTIHRYNAGRSWEQQLSLQVYTHTDRDSEQLTEWLMACLEEPGLAGPAMALLLHFQCPDLMLTDEHPDLPVPFPVVVLQNVLTKMVALPVEVSYTLPETLDALEARHRYARKDAFHYVLGHGIRSEPIHAIWHRGNSGRLDPLRQEASLYLLALRSLLWSVREQVGDQLFAWPPRFQLPPTLGISDALLSRLAFFTRYESVMQYLQVRTSRAEPQVVRTQLGLVAELVAVSDVEFEVNGETALDLEESGLPGWLLSRATESGRRAQLEFRDYATRAKMFMKPSPHLAMVSIERVDEEGGVPQLVRLKYSTKFESGTPSEGERFHLQKRFTDFNTDRVIEYLQELDRAGGGLFLALLREPSSAARQRPLPTPVETSAASEENTLRLTDSQLAAYRAIRRRRIVAVWGPPGTGKTHFLAMAILGLARAHAAAGKPFRVLITAFTHAAIENLLRKVVELRSSRAASGQPVAIGKIKQWQGDTPSGAATIQEDRVAQWLATQPLAVVGATVYSCIKAGKKAPLPGFDLVVVDEASQVRVAESAIAVTQVGADGRLVLAGDDLQLPPVVQGIYPEPDPGEPMLHRSIFEAVRSRVPVNSPIVQKLLENRRMNDVLTSFAARLLYGPDYRCFDASVAARRLTLPTLALRAPGQLSEVSSVSREEFPSVCLDPAYPLVVVILEGIQATKHSPVEARLVADLVLALREHLLDGAGVRYASDQAFFRHGVFVVSPHRAQNRAIRQELNARREWTASPFVDTVDKMQGQEADAVVVSYGVSDPEYALLESEFIYSVNRLNVSITRARSKSVVFLPRPLLDSLPRVLDNPEAERGLAFMRNIVDGVRAMGTGLTFDLEDRVRAIAYRADRQLSHC